jgi:GT2 family glycosyltransferase
MKVAIVTTVFNRSHSIQSLIRRLDDQKDKDFRLYVVDHGTNPLKPVQSEHFSVEWLRGSPEMWFSAAANFGLRYVQNEQRESVVVFLNDDASFSDPEFFKKLAGDLKPDEIMGCMCIDQKGLIVYSGLRFRPLKFAFDKFDHGKKLEFDCHEPIVACDTLPTRCIAFHTSALEKVGYLNEKALPQYASDFEWTIRAKRNGYRLLMRRDIHIRTAINPLTTQSSGRRFYERNKLKSFINDFLNPHRQGNLRDLINFSRLVFSWPYRPIFIFIHVMRRFGGFVITNYFQLSVPKQ